MLSDVVLIKVISVPTRQTPTLVKNYQNEMKGMKKTLRKSIHSLIKAKFNKELQTAQDDLFFFIYMNAKVCQCNNFICN